MAIASLILEPGTMLGGYRIENVVGIGGMAVVYRAEQLTLSRPVALKVLSPELSRDPVFRERFRREGQHVAALEHPHIIPIYDADEAEGRLYLATRLIEGETLAQRMTDGGLSADEALAVLGPIADALDAAHRAGVIHRDVKPQNILLTAQGDPFLADFGVAKSATGHGLTATGGFLGSVSYASPEQIRGESLTSAGDIYSLAAIVYQCLTGQVPYPRDTDASVMHAHLSEPPPSLPADAGRLQEVIADGMAKRPEHRPASAGALIRDLERALSDVPTLQRRAVPSFAPGRAATPADGRVPGEMTIAVDATVHDPRRDPAPAPVAPAPRSRRKLWIGLAAAVATTAIAVVAALLLLPSHAADTARIARSGALRIEYGAGWSTRVGRAPVVVEGLRLKDPVLLAGPAGPDVVVRVGRLLNDGDQNGALPADVADGFAHAPAAVPVRVGRVPGVRYEGRMDDGSQARLWLAPTTAGQLVVGCVVQTSPLSACDGAIARAELMSARSVPVGPDPALAKRLDTLLGRLKTRRSAGALVKRDLSARARAARQVAAADVTAARGLRAARTAPIDAAAVRATASALALELHRLNALGRATTERDRKAYARATTLLKRAGARVTSAYATLRRHGYAVGRPGTLRVPALPEPRPKHKKKAPVTTTASGPPAAITPPPSTPRINTPTPTPTPTPKAKKKPGGSGGYGPIVVAPAQ